jgi:hypothetical protein
MQEKVTLKLRLWKARYFSGAAASDGPDRNPRRTRGRTQQFPPTDVNTAPNSRSQPQRSNSTPPQRNNDRGARAEAESESPPMTRRSLTKQTQHNPPASLPISLGKISNEKRKDKCDLVFYGDDDEASMEVTQSRTSAGDEILHVVFYGPDLGLRIDRSTASPNTAVVLGASKLAQLKGIGVGDEVISIDNTDLASFSFTETVRWLRNAGILACRKLFFLAASLY